MNSNRVSACIIEGTNKNGKSYKALQFIIHTDVGDYKSGLIFPSPFEWVAIEKCISKVGEIYG